MTPHVCPGDGPLVDESSPSAGGGASWHAGEGDVGEGERRRRIDAMDPDALRALASSMPVIEQAKGVLMGCFGVDATAAFDVLRRVSSTRNVKLRDLAATVVAAASSGAGTTRTPASSPVDQVRRALAAGQDDTPEARP